MKRQLNLFAASLLVRGRGAVGRGGGGDPPDVRAELERAVEERPAPGGPA